jgi:Ni,Fe-hydrogenase III small subunit/ferredoxin
VTPWVLRGLRNGVVTTRYPARPDADPPETRVAISLVAPQGDPTAPPGRADLERVVAICPTGALSLEAVPRAPGSAAHGIRLDRGRCILCGRCVAARPDLFRPTSLAPPAALRRSSLLVPAPEDDDALDAVRGELARRTSRLRRSVHVRHVDAGSDGAEEWEIAALTNPVYDVQRLGIFFTASPRHADILLVTGVGSPGMAEPLRRTYAAMASPRVVVAAGVDAASGGILRPGGSETDGKADLDALVPVDVWIPGSPPTPFALLQGLLVAVGRLAPEGRER